MMRLENETFTLQISETTGAITSLVIKGLRGDLIGERRLCVNFRLGLPLEDYQCHYIEGIEQRPQAVTRDGDCVTVRLAGMTSARGAFAIDLEYTIELAGDEIRLAAKLTNHEARPISEFWFPQVGGWTRFGEGREAKIAFPGYTHCDHEVAIFKSLPTTQGLGAPATEWWLDYPTVIGMPWNSLYDATADVGLYLGYHDTELRFSSWLYSLHPRDSGRSDAWLKPEEAGEEPVGLTFSHVRYPFIANGESFASGQFILRAHKGDWHYGSRFYREWFLRHFPIDNSKSWLRKQSVWFSSIIYQPEDRLLVDYAGYDQWCREAEPYGIDTFELVGWDKGGLERDYPEYVPETKLGGRAGFRQLLKSIEERGKHSLIFINYNILDQNTDWYKRELHAYTHQDLFGSTPNWMTWGESTLLARKGYARKHVLASIVPPLEKILENYFLELIRDGAQGFQIDKVCVCGGLDFNPLNMRKPDVALGEGLIQAIGRLLEKCRAIKPSFCLASEASQDRLLPYVDVFYRSSRGYHISPLRFVFAEWTSCQHVSGPRDFRGVNGAVLTGSVIVVEPFTYQGSLAHPLYRALGEYVREVERIRRQLLDVIFLGNYFDTLDATVNPAEKQLIYRVHGHRGTNQRALIIANDSEAEIEYRWKFLHRDVGQATLFEPFAEPRIVSQNQPVRIKGEGLQILVEEQD